MPRDVPMKIQSEANFHTVITEAEVSVMITAFPNETHRKRALDGGAVGFLSKPFDEASLIRCLVFAKAYHVDESI